MIVPEKMPNALHAMNKVLVQLRWMAFERVRHEDLANALDIAELLPLLIARKTDATAEFRGHLEDLVQMNEGFGPALQYFDRPAAGAE